MKLFRRKYKPCVENVQIRSSFSGPYFEIFEAAIKITCGWNIDLNLFPEYPLQYATFICSRVVVAALLK